MNPLPKQVVLIDLPELPLEDTWSQERVVEGHEYIEAAERNEVTLVVGGIRLIEPLK